jgi:hypothetical protein
MSISQSASRCIQLLETQAATTSAQLRQELENTNVRFKIWAGNVGAFAPGNASIDYRLRDESEVLDILLVLLDRLRELLERAILPSFEEAQSENECDSIIVEHQSDSSDSSSTLSVDAEESNTSLEATQDPMTKANAIVDDLYHLSAILNKSASSNENSQVKAFVAKEVDMAEQEEQRKFASYVRYMIENHHFPKAPKALTERLVSTITFRHMMLLLRQHHHAELSQDIVPTRVSDSPAHVQTGVTNALGGAHKSKPKDKRVTSTIQGTGGHMSKANASSLDAAGLANYAEPVPSSGIATTNGARRQMLDVPSLSDNVDEGTQNVLCPYCFRRVSKDDMKEPRWT